MRRINRRIKSSTLVEVIVAALIANIVFFFCFSITMEALNGNKMMREFKAETVGYNFLVREAITRQFKDEAFESGDMTLIKKVEPDQRVANLYRITVQVANKSGKILSESKCIIFNEKD